MNDTTTTPATVAEELASFERVGESHFQSRSEDLSSILERMESSAPEVSEQAYEELFQYGLSLDYVPPFTFDGQLAGYWRWQISWGGPSDEFRIYVDDDSNIREIIYVFQDWYQHTEQSVWHRDDILQAVDMIMEGVQ